MLIKQSQRGKPRCANIVCLNVSPFAAKTVFASQKQKIISLLSFASRNGHWISRSQVTYCCETTEYSLLLICIYHTDQKKIFHNK